MGYETALHKAWQDLAELNLDQNTNVKFLADEYTIDLENKRVMSLAGNAAAKDFIAILILHYLKVKLNGLPLLTSEWLDFKELSGVEGYLAAFRKRAIEPIIRKYGQGPEGILEVLERFPAKRVEFGDIGIVLEAFEGVPVLITLWRKDEEFGPEANMLFDKSIIQIFSVEDVVVLAGMVAGWL
ncbi:MAG: DUF3786 domain-containing protein [Candidatus Omnitrophica bacterium]|nr:DUF3786 domain-containing protein [Candidatus Omnitrophota bacterium]